MERVKHLFEVPNIIFVLAVNINQLQYAIQGYYGSPAIDGQEYLKRFIDLRYTLPIPDLDAYIQNLFNIHAFNDFFLNKTRLQHNSRYDADAFLDIAKDLISCSNINLRLINKIFAYARIALQAYPIRSAIPADLLFLLCFIKITNPNLYERIQKREFSIQDLINTLEKELPNRLFKEVQYSSVQQHLCSAVAALIIRYNYISRGILHEENFKGKVVDNQGHREFPIQTQKFDKEELNNALSYYKNNLYLDYELGLKDMLDRIDLTCNLQL